MTHDLFRVALRTGLRAGHFRLPRVLLPLVLGSLLLVLGACGGEPTDDAPEPTISREAFVSTYVDLRMAALRSPETEITPEERSRILEEHGVTSEELLRFVEVLSRDDPRAMQEIWAEVQDRIQQAREEAVREDVGGPGPAEEADSTDAGSGGSGAR
ncbi:MAG: hypothetical protein R3223_01160 [Longimicrobiales bacterium]|nr:hypothetical protein [Longimicrobiales bacterium]